MSAAALDARHRLIGLAETAQHLELALTIVTLILVQRHHVLPTTGNLHLYSSLPHVSTVVKSPDQQLWEGEDVGEASPSRARSGQDHPLPRRLADLPQAVGPVEAYHEVAPEGSSTE
jgi:hypothetical protein